MEKQIGEKAIEFDQNAGSDQHPSGSNHWSSRQIFEKVLHGLKTPDKHELGKSGQTD
jgi:hypothetical protein